MIFPSFVVKACLLVPYLQRFVRIERVKFAHIGFRGEYMQTEHNDAEAFYTWIAKLDVLHTWSALKYSITIQNGLILEIVLTIQVNKKN